MANARHILCLNSGSSSLKLALYALEGNAEQRLADGAAERIGAGPGRIWLKGPGLAPLERAARFDDHAEAIRGIFEALEHSGLRRPDAVGHRVVHGGPRHRAPERVTPELLTSLREMIPFAPLHLPASLQGIEAVATHFPELPQVVCFDTAFHADLPAVAKRFPLPRALFDAGVFRYGFHGLSYEHVVAALGAETLGRAVIAHLGNGASLAAVDHGRSIDTTMGLTPTGGFMMGTRTGDLDPGVLLFLMNRGQDAGALEHLVNHEAGLLGVSGSSSDMRTLLEKSAHDAEAALAVEMFGYQIRKAIGAMASALGGLDTLVFTGGIGEHAAPVRALICEGLGFLGIALDPALNARHAEVISQASSRTTVRVVAANEELTIARHTHDLL